MSQNKQQYILVDIGCIECGETTAIVGVFDSHEEALFKLRKLAHDWGETIGPNVKQFGYFDGGQHEVQVIGYPND